MVAFTVDGDLRRRGPKIFGGGGVRRAECIFRRRRRRRRHKKIGGGGATGAAQASITKTCLVSLVTYLPTNNCGVLYFPLF